MSELTPGRAGGFFILYLADLTDSVDRYSRHAHQALTKSPGVSTLGLSFLYPLHKRNDFFILG